MADCTKFYAPSEQGGSITCAQFDESQLELQILCAEVNALTGGFTEEFLGLVAGDRVTTANSITAVTAVYRNGIRQPTTAFSNSATQVIFLTGVPFGPSTGGTGGEDIIVEYY